MTLITGIEGNFEGSWQFVLQLFIVFNRADREPTLLQLLTLVTSLLSIMTANVDSKFADKPDTPLMEKAKLWPYALFVSIFNWVTISLIISTIQWNYIWISVVSVALPLALLALIVLCGLICCPFICLGVCLREKCGTSDKEEIPEANSDRKRISEAISEKEGRSEAISDGVEKSEAIYEEYMSVLGEFQDEISRKTKTKAAGVFIHAMILIVIAVLVNFYPETWIWNLWAQGYKLSDVAVVNSGYFNIVFGSCIFSGFLYVILHYFQVSKPEQEKQAKIEEEGRKHEIDVKNDLLEQETPV